MWRPFDVECPSCRQTHEQFATQRIGERRPSGVSCECPHCGFAGAHATLLGLPAPYMGEKILNPVVYGGTCDTMGAKAHMPLPDLPGAEEHSEQIRRAMKQLPDNATSQERSAVFADACRDAPSSSDYESLFNSSEYKAVEAENKRISKENTQKKKRAQALARGENVNFRRDKCAGDPNMTA